MNGETDGDAFAPIDAVVVLTHQDTEEDRKLAERGKELGIPLILGGHDHGECLEEWNGCYLAKAGSDAHRAVVVDLVWPSPEHTEPLVTMDFLPVDGYSRSWPVFQTCEKHMAKVHQLERLRGAVALLHFDPSQPMISSKRVRLKQTTMGHFLCNGLRDELEVDCVLFDGGNIRGNRDYDVIPQGSDENLCSAGKRAFTLADLETELPWPSEMTVVLLTGAELLSAVQCSRSHVPQEFGGFFQTDDGIYTHDDDQTSVTHVGGEPLYAEQNYRVGIIHDSLTGMNSHPVFESVRNKLGKRIPPVDAARPAKVLLLSYFARQAWFEMPSFDEMDTDAKGFLTREEVRAGYLSATASKLGEQRTDEIDRGTDIFVSQMLSLGGTSGQKVTRSEYKQIFGSHMPRCRTPSPNRLRPRGGSYG